MSSINGSQYDKQAAALSASWPNGFAAVNYHRLLANASLEPRRHYFIVMDELWRALRSGPDMVNRIDGLTRLNRNVGIGQAMYSHTMTDQLALPTKAERRKAAGFVERAGMVARGGLPPRGVPLIEQAGIRLSGAETADVTSWSTPGSSGRPTDSAGGVPDQDRLLPRDPGRGHPHLRPKRRWTTPNKSNAPAHTALRRPR